MQSSLYLVSINVPLFRKLFICHRLYTRVSSYATGRYVKVHTLYRTTTECLILSKPARPKGSGGGNYRS